jgi:hypothetical protein
MAKKEVNNYTWFDDIQNEVTKPVSARVPIAVYDAFNDVMLRAKQNGKLLSITSVIVRALKTATLEANAELDAMDAAALVSNNAKTPDKKQSKSITSPLAHTDSLNKPSANNAQTAAGQAVIDKTTCKCGQPLINKTGKNGNQFVGCSAWTRETDTDHDKYFNKKTPN